MSIAGVRIQSAQPGEAGRSIAAWHRRSCDGDSLAIGAAAPNGGFFDFAPIHLMTSASLDAISTFASDDLISAERYRPNLVVETTSSTAFAENQWVGRQVVIGQSVKLEIIAPTPRCAVPMLSHSVLPGSTAAVGAVNKSNKVSFRCLGQDNCHASEHTPL
jgi:hypothetical protein